ncbi:MAG: hypothetical protein IPI49_19930 [Myxococcales bacterium]|nr:hypothetical protein [Myxococcales bacterium]
MQTFSTSTLNIDSNLLTFTAECRKAELLDACRRAVDCLERFAAQARRELEQAAADPSAVVRLPGKLLHACAWGSANASTELSTATTIVAEYMRATVTVEERRILCARVAP